MAQLNALYGSEIHLLRMLGRHRHHFNSIVQRATGADEIDWLDFPSGALLTGKDGKPRGWDREWRHLEFLSNHDPAKSAWARSWPTDRQGHNWDAVARLRYGTTFEWLLVEAKANVEELRSPCEAEDENSLRMIREAVEGTRSALGAPSNSDWLKPYYQFCNRVTVLHSLNRSDAAARLLFVYFFGDVRGSGRTCPQSPDEWQRALAAQDAHVGLPASHELTYRIHKVFVDAQCASV